MTKQNILIIGSGGREHALAWKVAQSPHLGKLYVAPGNGGTAAIATNVDLKATAKTSLVEFAKANDIHLTIVGPDDILAIGMVDAFQAEGLRIFGPTQAAARIESSKAFSKELMTKQHIPTAKYATFTGIGEARDYVKDHPFPLVVKASGLALGKGVYICHNLDEANQALDEIMLQKVFGDSGSTVVIEQFLTGQEVSIHAFCDGRTAKLFPTSQDHKAIHDGDKGPNTGGMGAFAPVPWVKPELIKLIDTQVVEPALAGLKAAGSPFAGLLFPGLMVADDDVNVLEFNSRFGDPEAQVYMRLLETDLVELINACVDGQLADLDIKWSDQTAVCVVIASPGYPGKSTTGMAISGLDEAAAQPDVTIFHAGTAAEGGQIFTAGGRVLGITATGADIREAQAKAYTAVKLIQFDGLQYRTDIGDKALKRPAA